MRKILFFSCEPGGAEVLIPVIELLDEQPAYQVAVCAYGLGARRFADKGIGHVVADPVMKEDGRLLESFRPDLVITSAASLPERDMSEKHLWHHARLAGIPSIAFLDQWQNYAVRFSGVDVAERLAYQPDYINCINAIGRGEMMSAGFEESKLVEFGHPSLSAVLGRSAQVDIADVRGRLGLGTSDTVALFVSEAIREHYGRERGYDQYDALRLFLEIVARTPESIRPLIKLHPKDAPSGYEDVLKGYASLKPLLVRDELSPVECIEVAEMTFGMTSVMLIEAYVLRKKTVSLQPGLCVEDPMVLSRMACIPRIDSADFGGSIGDLSRFEPQEARFDYVFKEREFLSFVGTLLAT